MTRAAKEPVRKESVRAVVREAVRSELLKASERVFARCGFHATKMADIAGEAGVAVGTLYNYFDSKEEIFRAIVVDSQQQFRSRIEPLKKARDPLERLEGIVRTVMTSIEEKGGVFAVFFELGAISEFDIQRVGGDVAHQGHREFLETLTDAVRACVTAGRLRRDISVYNLVGMLSGAMNGVVYSWFARGRRGRLATATDELWTLFLTGASK